MGGYASTWNLEKISLVFRQPSFFESSSVAVSPDGTRIALAGGWEFAEFEWNSGSLRFGTPVAEGQNRLAYTSKGVVSYDKRAMWRNSGDVEHLNINGMNSDGKGLIAGGDWFAQRGNDNRATTLCNARVSANPALRATTYAISPDGNYAVTSDEGKNGSGDVNVSKLSLSEPRLVPVFSQPAKSLKTMRAIFEKSSKVAFVKADGIWLEVAVPSGKSRTVANSAWLESALEFSNDGTFVLTPAGVTRGRGADTKVINFVPSPSDVAGEFAGDAKLAYHDQLALFPTKEGILIWSTTNGHWLGQLKHVVQGMVFTQDKPGEQGRGLVEVFGDTARESLLCESGVRLYPWEVCADRFESPGLLKAALLASSRKQ
jgi:WD40 repeat protein